MAEHTINTRIKIRQDTASNWETKNPSLLDGEICYDTTTRRFKIGIGNANWNDLPFVDRSSIIETVSAIPEDATQYLIWVRSEKDGFSYLFKRDDVFIDKDGYLHDKRGKLASQKDISAIINYGTNMRYGQNTQLDWYYKHQYLHFGEITTVGQRVLNLYSQSLNAGDFQSTTIYVQELVVVDISKGTGLNGNDIITFTPTKESYSGFYSNNMYHTLGTSNYDKQVVMSRYGVSKALEGLNKTIIRRWS